MSEPDWTNVKSVRAWLEKRYPIANKDTGSPFFLYLKDELHKGNKIRGRENHLSRHEFMRWVWEANMTEDGPRGFHYSGNDKRTPYYPEYVDDQSQSRSQSPAQCNNTIKHKLVHESSKPLKNRPSTKPQKKKLARKNKNAKQDVSAALGDGKASEKSITKGVKQIDKDALQRQKARIATLRPRKNCQRSETGTSRCPLRSFGSVKSNIFVCLDFFHPDKSRQLRARKG